MESMVVFLIAASVLIGCVNNLAMGWEESEVVHVAGKVMCQDCTKSFEEWMNGDRPIKGCRVSLTCMDDRKRVMYYDSDETDDLGQYNMVVDKNLLYGKKINEKLCSVRLLSSPEQTCNVVTNFGNGKSGVKLRRPTSVYRNVVRYDIGNFYYTTPMCERPA